MSASVFKLCGEESVEYIRMAIIKINLKQLLKAATIFLTYYLQILSNVGYIYSA